MSNVRRTNGDYVFPNTDAAELRPGNRYYNIRFAFETTDVSLCGTMTVMHQDESLEAAQRFAEQLLPKEETMLSSSWAERFMGVELESVTLIEEGEDA